MKMNSCNGGKNKQIKVFIDAVLSINRLLFLPD